MKRAKLPTVHTRRLQANAIIITYEVKNGLASSYIWDFFFVVTNYQYHLRNSDSTIPRFRTVAYGKHSLTLGPFICSKLDKSIQSSESLDFFKKRIKLVNFANLLDSACNCNK